MRDILLDSLFWSKCRVTVTSTARCMHLHRIADRKLKAIAFGIVEGTGEFALSAHDDLIGGAWLATQQAERTGEAVVHHKRCLGVAA